MIALQVESEREFLNLLLEGSEFDRFFVGKCEVTTFVTFSTNGIRRYSDVNSDGVQEEGLPERVYWREIKESVYDMIKKSPIAGTLELDLFKYMSGGSGLDGNMGSLRISFGDGKFQVTTGYMQKEFSLDHRGSEDWDDEVHRFLVNNGIAVSAL